MRATHGKKPAEQTRKHTNRTPRDGADAMNVSNDIPTRNETAGTVPTNAPEGNAPKVSVVVPVYNVEQYLDKALHSLHVQTLKNMEFVCVNDAVRRTTRSRFSKNTRRATAVFVFLTDRTAVTGRR